nr:hypothetical protein Iba_chr04bCG7020 [Ipomoea batatas]GMC84142.1 hypothetical protein Iba_chr04cCG8780 [Ipomoea batatas]GMC85865.1 hypothetical protein Iba_chr04dCG5450 [Ipomoea batatas]GMD18071.1 hypothetical protein Iba_scaffold41379CG0020 [Ipomoea batatas]
MAAVRQNNLGLQLQANPTFLLSLQFDFGKLSLVHLIPLAVSILTYLSLFPLFHISNSPLKCQERREYHPIKLSYAGFSFMNIHTCLAIFISLQSTDPEQSQSTSEIAICPLNKKHKDMCTGTI